MSSKKIPTRTVYTCDRCGLTGEALHSGAFEFEYTDLKITTGGKDGMGNTGGGKSEINLCGACSVDFRNWMMQTRVIKPQHPRQDHHGDGPCLACEPEWPKETK